MREPDMVQTHHHSGEEGAAQPLRPHAPEEFRHGPSDHKEVLRLHHREHLDRLHHCPEELTEGGVDGTIHHWGNVLALQNIYTRQCLRKA